MAQIRSLLGLQEDDGPARLKLSSVIRFVMQKSVDKPIILVIDECQELDFINESFWSELQQVWDLKKKQIPSHVDNERFCRIRIATHFWIN